MKQVEVINDKMLFENGEYEDGNRAERARGLHSVTKLNLSYKNIMAIQSLKGLPGLETLLLDNNLIRSIENLNFLQNLKWLDLSFNCIKKVEGLNGLTNLTDLSLFSNVIENVTESDFQGLRKLSVLSLANNKLSNTAETIKALRPLPSLEVLTLKDNPLFNEEAKNQVILALKNLKYLDYNLIDESARLAAEELKPSGDIVNALDSNEQVDRAETVGLDETQTKLESFNLINYDKFLQKDIRDLEVFLGIKNAFEESSQKFSDNVRHMIEGIRSSLNTALENKQRSVAEIDEALSRMMSESESLSRELIRKYQYSKKHNVRKLEETTNPNVKSIVEAMQAELKTLDHALVERQIVLKNLLKLSYASIDKNIKLEYTNIEQIVTGELGLRRMDDIINEFYTKFVEEAIAEAERYEKHIENDQAGVKEDAETSEVDENEDEEDTPWTEAQAALLDKDEVKGTANAIKEALEAKHKQVDAKIRSEIAGERNLFLNKVAESHKEIIRKNLNNIYEFVNAENEFWNQRTGR